jgi:hypothetical protein
VRPHAHMLRLAFVARRRGEGGCAYLPIRFVTSHVLGL